MIPKNRLIKAAEFLATHIKADDFTINAGYGDKLDTRFAQNGITQHINGARFNINLSLAFGSKTGTASANDLSETALLTLIEKAETMAQLNQPDPEFVASEGAHTIPVVNNFSQETAELPLEAVVDGIKKCVENALSRDAKVSGITTREFDGRYLLTKNGFSGWDQSTTFSHSMTMKKGGVETKVSGSVKNFTNFDMDKMIKQLNNQFDALSKPETFKTGRIPVIMRPAAVLDWIQYMFWMYQQRMADDGMTPYTGQLGKQFFGEKFTLRSTFEDPELSTPAFNGAGIPADNLNWVKNGVIENMQVGRDYAKVKGIKPTFNCNFVMEGGTTTEEEMMQMVDRGIIINRLWYIRPIDQKKGEMTGLTRDGVLYFENGKVQKAVTNFRWNEIMYDISNRILAMGPTVLQESYAKVPTILVDGFNFVDVTTF